MTYMTHAETENLLQNALSAKGSSIKSIAEALNLRPNTLYKFHSGNSHLSSQSLDRLLLHMMTYEPERLYQAEEDPYSFTI